MQKFAFVAVILPILPSPGTASEPAQEAGGAPTAAELQELVQALWPSFSRRIRRQDGLIEVPGRFTSLPQALCRREFRATYECVSLVEYQLASGTPGTSLLRHHVDRDAQGRLLDAIIIRETPAPR